jgi:hypothetical protein
LAQSKPAYLFFPALIFAHRAFCIKLIFLRADAALGFQEKEYEIFG